MRWTTPRRPNESTPTGFPGCLFGAAGVLGAYAALATSAAVIVAQVVRAII